MGVAAAIARRHRLSRLVRACVLSGLVGIGAAAQADPMNPATATPGELARLPEYCAHVWGYTRDAQARAAWFVRLGPVFEHMHHYCWGLLKANRAEGPGIEPQLRRSLYSSAVRECEYVLRSHPDPAFVLRPEILYKMGLFEAANSRWIEAIEYFQHSIEAKADYWPPYIGIADIHLKLGRREPAIKVLNEGLKASPGEIRLREALKRASENRPATGRTTGSRQTP